MINKIKTYYLSGARFLNDPFHQTVGQLNKNEMLKRPNRTHIINHLIQYLNRDITYLEIGVRNPNDNFNLIEAKNKYSVDPGLEFTENPVDFKLTSDAFFEQLKQGKILNPSLRFDVIFIDGLHLAEQVEKDIDNALAFIKEDGFIILHDCNPPSEWHAREEYHYQISPAMNNWNGTTWKAFYKARLREDIFSCCIDTDWGVGILSKTLKLGPSSKINNPYFEFKIFENHRKDSLNLITFNELKSILNVRA